MKHKKKVVLLMLYRGSQEVDAILPVIYKLSKEFTISHDWIVLLAVPNDEITDNWERIYGPGIIKPTTKILYS